MADKAKLLKLAQKHLSKGNLDKAIKTFQQLVETDPRDQRLILRLADIQARAGRKKEAIGNYEKVAAGYVRQDFTPKAIAVYRTILRLDPELLTAYEKLAGLYKNQGLEAEALSQYENLFQVYEKKNNEDKQIEVLKLMAEMDPENLGFQVRLGETLANKGRKKEAAEAFAKAAATLSRRGYHDRASQLFEKITSLNPENTTVRRELCAHYLESGQYNEARAEIEAILEIEPDDPRMSLLLGRILFQLGDKVAGEEKISRSIELFLNTGELESVMREFLFVAKSHLKNGEVDEAEAFYRQIVSSVPGEVRAIKGLISVAETRKDRVGQIDNLLLLGRTMQQGGDPGEAASAFRKVNELDPLNQEARDYLEGARYHETSAELSEARSITLGEDVVDSDLEEIEELELIDTEEIELEDISPDAIVEDLEEEIEISEVEEGEVAFEDEMQQVEFVGEETGEGAVPDIVLEDFLEDEVVMETSEDAEDDLEVGPEPAGTLEEEIPEAFDQEPVEMSLEELLAEVDVYERYGLEDKAAQSLEKARVMAPDDRKVIDRIAAFESRVQGDAVPPAEGISTSEKAAAPEFQEAKDPDHDPFGEDLEEADFYHSQGLDDEASRIYRSILQRDPRHQRAAQGLASIDGVGGTQEPGEPALPVETTLESQFDPDSAKEVRSKLIVEDSAPEDMGGFFDIADELRTELADEFDANAESGVADGPVSFEEIFSQFKKGIEETLGDEEYETHYNLGIAYKDMGLYEDAIREFESGARDPALAQDSFSLMAMCYVEQKEYDSAVKAIEQAFEASDENDRTGLFYQLGEVREKQKLWSEAVEAYEQVQSSDPAFERIGEAIQRVKASFAEGAPEEDSGDLSVDSDMDDMLTDLIREVEEMALESSGETKGDPGKSKKDRISYL
jgi:tetratricopeptide (TPR) repeat protein